MLSSGIAVSNVYHQDDDIVKLNIYKEVVSLSRDYDVRRPQAKRWRRPQKDLGAVLVRFSKSHSCFVVLRSHWSIVDSANSENPGNDCSGVFEKSKLPSVWRKSGRHEKRDQEQTQMTQEIIKQLLDDQTAEIKKIVSANSKWSNLWAPIAIVIAVCLALFAFYITFNASLISVNNNVNDKLMGFTKDLDQFELKLTSDVNKQFMDFRKDLSQFQLTIMEQLQKIQPTKQP